MVNTWPLQTDRRWQYIINLCGALLTEENATGSD